MNDMFLLSLKINKKNHELFRKLFSKFSIFLFFLFCLYTFSFNFPYILIYFLFLSIPLRENVEKFSVQPRSVSKNEISSLVRFLGNRSGQEFSAPPENSHCPNTFFDYVFFFSYFLSLKFLTSWEQKRKKKCVDCWYLFFF